MMLPYKMEKTGENCVTFTYTCQFHSIHIIFNNKDSWNQLKFHQQIYLLLKGFCTLVGKMTLAEPKNHIRILVCIGRFVYSISIKHSINIYILTVIAAIVATSLQLG